MVSALAGWARALFSEANEAAVYWVSMNPEFNSSNYLENAPKSLVKGVLVNALSPHPYLFWFSVGGPLLNKAATLGMAAPIGFLASFYLLLVGAKITLAILVGKSKMLLRGSWYPAMMRSLGIALFVLAYFLFRDGLLLLGLIQAE